MQKPLLLIREAEISDAVAIAKVHVDSWRSTYAGIVPTDYLAGLTYEQREQVWHKTLSAPSELGFVYVAEDAAGNVVGFASGGAERSDHNDYKEELFAVYLSDQYQRLGTGSQLVSCVATSLLQQGIQSMLVWVLANNPACRFYEALGGKLASEQTITIGGETLSEVAYGWEDISQLAANMP